MADDLKTEIAQLESTTTTSVGAMESATTLINGFKDILDAAIADALARGATEEELTKIDAVSTMLEEKSAALAAAVAANPGPNPGPGPTPTPQGRRP